MSWHGFLCVYHIWSLINFLNLCFYCIFCQKLVNFQPFFFSNSFLAPITICSLWDSNDVNITSLLWPHKFLTLFIFPQSAFSLLSRLGNFYLSIFKFTDSFLSSLHCVAKPIHCGFFHFDFSVFRF